MVSVTYCTVNVTKELLILINGAYHPIDQDDTRFLPKLFHKTD